jgi:hypothetical protein
VLAVIPGSDILLKLSNEGRKPLESEGRIRKLHLALRREVFQKPVQGRDIDDPRVLTFLQEW